MAACNERERDRERERERETEMEWEENRGHIFCVPPTGNSTECMLCGSPPAENRQRDKGGTFVLLWLPLFTEPSIRPVGLSMVTFFYLCSDCLFYSPVPEGSVLHGSWLPLLVWWKGDITRLKALIAHNLTRQAHLRHYRNGYSNIETEAKERDKERGSLRERKKTTTHSTTWLNWCHATSSIVIKMKWALCAWKG